MRGSRRLRGTYLMVADHCRTSHILPLSLRLVLSCSNLREDVLLNEGLPKH